MSPGDTYSKSDFTAAMFEQDTIDDDPYTLNDGSKIAVVGGTGNRSSCPGTVKYSRSTSLSGLWV